MKRLPNITQNISKILSILMVLLSAFAVYKGNTDIAKYLVLVALYTLCAVDTTVIVSEEDDEENE